MKIYIKGFNENKGYVDISLASLIKAWFVGFLVYGVVLVSITLIIIYALP